MGDVPAKATLTYLFSDIEGSTRALGSATRRRCRMRWPATTRSCVLRSRAAAERWSRQLVTGSWPCSTRRRTRSLRALRRRRGCADEPWGETGPLRVRMGTHVGDAETRGGTTTAPPSTAPPRRTAAAHGGQVLLSAPIAELVTGSLPDDVHLRDLGTHRLKDLAGPEHLFQLLRPGLQDTFPPLETLDVRPNNLPTQTSALLGRGPLLHDLRAQLDAEYARLLTLVGPGGTGKTRLAFQAAAEQVDRFPQGVFLVHLTAEREPDAATPPSCAPSRSPVPADDPPLEALKRGLRELRFLLVLDNFEQVAAAATDLAELLAALSGAHRARHQP